MIDYTFRNHKTGMEIKKRVEKELKFNGEPLSDLVLRIFFKIPSGYKLQQIVPYKTTAKERKAK